MDYVPYHSRNTLYKQPFGAVKEGSFVTFKILLDDNLAPEKVVINYHADGGETITRTLKSAEIYEGTLRFYETKIKFTEGLYWYNFGYYDKFGYVPISRQKYALGAFGPGGDWQLTVYEKTYKTPTNYAGGIIYQIFPDRFFASKTKKENVPQDRFMQENMDAVPEYRQHNGPCSLGNDYYGGDLEGIRLKLPYLASLGVSILYLNPIFEAHSNHRYNTADYMKIDPLLGTEADFVRLCKEAKKFNISVILDGVFSHTGADSIYFDKYGRYGGKGAYNSPQSKYSNWFKFKNRPDDYSCWWGVPSLPETVEENPDFAEFITGENGVLRHWMRLGASGWRLDVADELPDCFLDKIREAVKAENKNGIIIGEVWEDATNKISYNIRRRYLRGKQLDSVMNYPLASAIIDFVTGGNAEDLCDEVMTLCENYPRQSLCLLMNHVGTHDTPRILTALGGESDLGRGRAWQATATLSPEKLERSKKLLYLTALLQYTLPGIPSLYYGDEAATEGYGDPFCRAFYPWGKEDPYLLDFYKKLGLFRRTCKSFKDGDFIPLHTSLGMFSFIRKADTEQTLICVNRWFETDYISAPEGWEKAKVIFGYLPEDGKIRVDALGFTVLTMPTDVTSKDPK